MKIKLTNTLSKKEEVFVPIKDKKVSMYVCGITPYDHSHIGHGRCYVVYDILLRLFKILGYEVNYVRNFTDIDDKILNKTKEEFGDISDYAKIASRFIDAYHKDMQSLGCLKPSHEPKVSENVPQIIKFIEELIKKNKAYVVGHDVYFDISSFPDYGKLSNRKVEDLLVGARVEASSEKRNPADFVLWKGNKENLFWKAPWGHGRPGWHIECSVLAQKYLGDVIDIHGGGMDLIFPHHENEIAQSESLHGKEFSRFWIHNAFVNLNKEKMSKSLGNVFSLKDIFEKFDPMILRFYFLQHHFKTPIDFSFEYLEASSKAYKKLVNLFADIDVEADYKFSESEKNPLILEMIGALCDNLNMPKLLGILFENIQKIDDESRKREIKNFLTTTTGLTFEAIEAEEIVITPEIKKLIEERNQARVEKNWKKADEIRGKLKEMGIEAQDQKV
jgi:cysteinyl-tRNA synthetase